MGEKRRRSKSPDAASEPPPVITGPVPGSGVATPSYKQAKGWRLTHAVWKGANATWCGLQLLADAEELLDAPAPGTPSRRLDCPACMYRASKYDFSALP